MDILEFAALVITLLICLSGYAIWVINKPEPDPLRARIEREIAAIDKCLESERLSYQHEELKAQKRVLCAILDENNWK